MGSRTTDLWEIAGRGLEYDVSIECRPFRIDLAIDMDLCMADEADRETRDLRGVIRKVARFQERGDGLVLVCGERG
jgi:hypothetical protein